MPYRPGLYGYLLPNGHVFYGGKLMEDLDRFEAWPRFKGGAVLEVDWHGRVLWEVRHPDHHHDARLLRNGNVLLLFLSPLPPATARPRRPAGFRLASRAPKPTERSTPTIWSR